MPRDEPFDAPEEQSGNVGDRTGVETDDPTVEDVFVFQEVFEEITGRRRPGRDDCAYLVGGNVFSDRATGRAVWVLRRVETLTDDVRPGWDPIGVYRPSTPENDGRPDPDVPEELVEEPYVHLFPSSDRQPGPIAGSAVRTEHTTPLEIRVVSKPTRNRDDGRSDDNGRSDETMVTEPNEGRPESGFSAGAVPTPAPADPTSISINVDAEVDELRRLFPDVSRTDFYHLDNDNIGVEVSYVPSDCAIAEFEVLIEYVPQYPGVPPRLWVTDPEIDPGSGLVTGFDEYGNAQAKYAAPYEWSSEYTAYDAARMMKSWIKHYCAYLDDDEPRGLARYVTRVEEEIGRLRGN